MIATWLVPLIAVACQACFSGVASAQPSERADAADATGSIGTRLVDYLERIRSEGLTVIYSSELVPDSLRLESEPIGATPRIRLGSALSPFGLALERGPQDSWLVVRTDSPAPPGVAPTDPPEVTLELPPIENVIVTASRYSFARASRASTTFVDRLQLETTPAIGDDALRPLANVPGVSANGLSGEMAIRGGDTNEALILLDGVELRSPFHLKDFESIFGSISPRIVDRMDVHTGGFSAMYGGRMSGVVDMRTISPQERRHFEVGVSTINSSFLSSGRFDADRGDWLVSLRRGTVDLLLDAADSDSGTPQFTDFFGRVSKRLGESGEWRFGMMTLNDKLSLHDGPQAQAGADYDDRYLWTGYEHELSDSLSAQYLLTFVDVDSSRTGFTDSPSTSVGRLADRRVHTNTSLSAEWTYRRNDRHRFQWGVSFARSDARYDFQSQIDVPYPVTGPLPGSGDGFWEFTGRFDDSQAAAFLTSRLRVHDELTVELGARLDSQSIVDELEFSPRIGFVWDASDRLTLRAAWGRYTQPNDIDELQVSDRNPLVYESQRSEQKILSFEFDPDDRTRLRVELFDKQIDNPQPRFENMFMRLSLLPELLPDRVLLMPSRARASGVEVSLDSQLAAWRWWLSYTRSKAEDLVDAQWLRRSWQENWSVKSGFVWTGSNWTVSTSLVTRSGWPISVPEVQNGEIVVQAFNDRSFERFRSLDVRASRLFDLRHGELEAFVQVVNLFDQNNACCYEYDVSADPGGGVTDLNISTQQWLPSIPALGVLWTF